MFCFGRKKRMDEVSPTLGLGRHWLHCSSLGFGVAGAGAVRLPPRTSTATCCGPKFKMLPAIPFNLHSITFNSILAIRKCQKSKILVKIVINDSSIVLKYKPLYPHGYSIKNHYFRCLNPKTPSLLQLWAPNYPLVAPVVQLHCHFERLEPCPEQKVGISTIIIRGRQSWYLSY
jgi:hypothetical protein